MLKRLMGGLTRWLDNGDNGGSSDSDDNRRAHRVPEPSLCVYYWDGSVPEAKKLRDVSSTGAYIVTPERWYIGTIVRLVLQGYKTTSIADRGIVPSQSTSIPCRVMRHGPDGLGVEFLFSTPEERKMLETLMAKISETKGEVAGNGSRNSGQALVEFALVLPLLFLLIVNTVNFGAFLFAWITVANSARAGAQYMVLAGAAVGTPKPATAAEITALITSDVSSLLNRASLTVRVCTNNNSVITCSGTGSYVPPADPEPTQYVLASVNVTYAYQPLLPLWDFSSLGIHATLPPTIIHRQASMRMLQ